MFKIIGTIVWILLLIFFIAYLIYKALIHDDQIKKIQEESKDNNK